MSISPEDDEGGDATEGRAHRKLSRRDFLKWGVMAGAVAGLSSVGVASALGILKAPAEPVPEWEVAPGVVDYSLVPQGLAGPTPNVLKVAQWFQYWPGKFIDDFIAYMQSQYHMTVDVQVDIFGSNEELFNWITIGRKKYDVFFPSNYVVDLLKNGNMIYNLNTGWLPNFVANVGDDFKSVPKDDPFDRRGPTGDYVSVPYFWGTTGIGFRTDKLLRTDVVDQGFDLFWKDSFTNSDGSTVNLSKKMRLLEDERDVLGWGFKKAGWEEQVSKGYTPTALPYNPAPPYNGVYQWTTNEKDANRVNAAVDWLTAARPNLFDFNSTDAATSLVGGSAYYNQVWSGDVMYAKRPDQNQTMPVDYVLPKQGSTWWIDCAAIHSKSRNLWLAHRFIDFIHSVTDPWTENQLLTVWNLYSTPNTASYDYILSHPFQNGWNMATDAVLYPNIYDKPNWANLDMSGDVGLDTLLNLYNPMWFELTTG